MKIQRYGGCRSSSPREEFRGIAAAKERRSQVALVSWASFSVAPDPARREWKPKVNGSPVLITRDQGMSLSGWKCLSKFQTRWLNNQGIQELAQVLFAIVPARRRNSQTVQAALNGNACLRDIAR
jgi:hypothetical protein